MPNRRRNRRIEKQESSSSEEEESMSYEVEKILKKRIRNNQKQYFVKWRGYSNSQSTWQPVSNLANCAQELIKFQIKNANICDPFQPQQFSQSLFKKKDLQLSPAPTVQSCQINQAQPSRSFDRLNKMIAEHQELPVGSEIERVIRHNFAYKGNNLGYYVNVRGQNLPFNVSSAVLSQNQNSFAQLVNYYEQNTLLKLKQ